MEEARRRVGEWVRLGDNNDSLLDLSNLDLEELPTLPTDLQKFNFCKSVGRIAIPREFTRTIMS